MRDVAITGLILQISLSKRSLDYVWLLYLSLFGGFFKEMLMNYRITKEIETV